MYKHHLAKILLLLCLLVSRPVEASLILGVGTGTDEAGSEITSEQASPPVSLPADKRQGQVVVKELTNSATLVEGQHVPPLSPGLALPLQEEGDYRAILPTGEPFAKVLLLAVLRDPGGLLRTAHQANSLVTYLEKALPVSIKVTEFGHLDTFAEWFLNYRIVDLAVVSPAVAKASLGTDYLPVAKLFSTDKPGIESTALVVMRRGQNEEMHAPLQRALLDMPQTADGKALLATLGIDGVLPPEGLPAWPTVIAPKPEPVTAIKNPLVGSAEEAVEKIVPPTPEHVAPVEPVAPPEVAVKPLPQLLEVAEPATVLPVLDITKHAPMLPEAATIPAETPAAAQVITPPVADKETSTHDLVRNPLPVAEAVPTQEFSGVSPVVVDEATEAWSDEEFAAMLNEDPVAAVVAQPDIPNELRPSRVPVVRPGRVPSAVDDQLLLATIPGPLKNVKPPHPPNLLPEPEPEPGVVYVVPFVSVMVPAEVNARVFDQFVDTLNREGEALGLQFVILKEGLRRVSPQWLSIRKYVTGEIYAYVEDSGCCSTDLRTKVRLSYYRPNQEAPAFGFESPARSFFDHDRSSLEIERIKLSDKIAGTLASELLKALQK